MNWPPPLSRDGRAVFRFVDQQGEESVASFRCPGAALEQHAAAAQHFVGWLQTPELESFESIDRQEKLVHELANREVRRIKTLQLMEGLYLGSEISPGASSPSGMGWCPTSDLDAVHQKEGNTLSSGNDVSGVHPCTRDLAGAACGAIIEPMKLLAQNAALLHEIEGVFNKSNLEEVVADAGGIIEAVPRGGA